MEGFNGGALLIFWVLRTMGLFERQFYMLDALAAPGVYHMEVAVSALNDGWIGVLQDRTVL